MRPMHIATRLVCAAFLALTAVTVTAGQALPADLSAAIDRVMEKAIAGPLPGASLAIAINNRVVFEKGYGQADLEHGIAVTTDTVFRTASVAKPMTATAVVQLAEAGKLDLDAPIRKYCTAWPDKHPTITARQLLGHLGGVRHYARQGESTGTRTYFSIEEALALFKDDALLHEPGTKYTYTTYGYTLLGCAIEGASGQSYIDYMTEHVFAPAGMTRTRQDFHYFVIPDRARGYMLMDERTYQSLPASAKRIAKAGAIYNANLHDTSMKVPGGGLVSTAGDLVRFGVAVNTGALLPKAAVEMMWTEQRTTGGEGVGYGMGWGVTEPQDGIRRLSHSGNQAGASSVLHVIPEQGIVIALMTNLEDYEAGTLSREVAQAIRTHVMERQR